MRAVVQRVRAARVEVAGEVVGEIGHGLCVFLGAGVGDEERDVVWTIDKLLHLRIFEDDAGKMGKSVEDVGGALLLVSQFTLFGDVRRGRRPSFEGAMPPVAAEASYERAVALARERGARVQTGRFRADMRVVVDNDGPVTICLDSRA